MKIDLDHDDTEDPSDTPTLDAAFTTAYDAYLERWAQELLNNLSKDTTPKTVEPTL